jgi:two-component system, chemotaxis family, chemotaxis protein CheY
MPSKRRILCVDDHEDMCSPAHSKAEALRKATGGLFDLYLLDYYLPDGTGLELCLLIRDFDDSTPILFVTDVAEPGQQQIQSVNAQGLILKDELPDALVPAVANLLTQ